MPGGFYFSFTYSEWWDHSPGPGNRQICSIVESILTALESGMALASQSRTNGPKTRQRTHRTGKSQDVIHTLKGISKKAKQKGDIDTQTLRGIFELLHAEIRRIMRTDLNLLGGSFMGNANIEAILTDVLVHFNTRLMQIMSSTLSIDSLGKENGRKNARLELLELTGYAGERTICALLNLQKRQVSQPYGGIGPPALLPPPPGFAGKIDEQRSPRDQSHGKPRRRQKNGTHTHKGAHDGKHKKRNKPCGKDERQATNDSSLSMATTAVPSSLNQYSSSAIQGNNRRTENKPYPEMHPVTTLPGTFPPAFTPAMAIEPPVHPAVAQPPASAVVPIPPPPCSNISKKPKTSVFSFPSDSTPLGEIPAHKLARPLHPNKPRGQPTMVSGKPGLWKKWMGKG